MSAADDRRKAAEEGKDVTPTMGSDNKVTRIEITEKGPKEVQFDIIDLDDLRDSAVKALAKADAKADQK